jgi:DNA-binding NarL/FixJ family response regulator
MLYRPYCPYSTDHSSPVVVPLRYVGRVHWSLKEALHHSTAGIALFGQDLLCKAVNSAFAVMTGLGLHDHTGKTMAAILGIEKSTLEEALQQSIKYVECVVDVRLRDRRNDGAFERQWQADFYPVLCGNGPDSLDLVCMVASEITARTKIERRAYHMARLFDADSGSGDPDWEAEFRGMRQGHLDLITKSVELLNQSMGIRRSILKIRVASSIHRESLRTAADDLVETRQECARLRSHEPEPKKEIPRKLPEENGQKQPSGRELQVLRYMVDGRTSKEIASELNLSLRTVETYRGRLKRKLNLHSAAEIVRYAIRHRLIDP